MKKKNGFTLIELGVVISAISVLAASTMTYNGFRQAAVHTQVRKALSDIRLGTIAGLGRVSLDEASTYNNWLEYLGDNDFIATAEDHSITFNESIKITQAAILTHYESNFMVIIVNGVDDIAAEDLLTAESTISSYYADAPEPMCNQQIPGMPIIILCYQP